MTRLSRGFDDLTECELEVFRSVARDLPNTEIGRDFYISETTVKTHITRILQNFNLRDRVQT
jgi:DNA-binding NarL/FixJ family response regulator